MRLPILRAVRRSRPGGIRTIMESVCRHASSIRAKMRSGRKPPLDCVFPPMAFSETMLRPLSLPESCSGPTTRNFYWTKNCDENLTALVESFTGDRSSPILTAFSSCSLGECRQSRHAQN